MPCSYNSTEDYLREANEVINRLTVLLCEAISNRSDLSPELLDWRAEHEAKEAGRVRREAVGKLTDQERRALGIDHDGLPVKVKL
jgi:hypothetical protein